MKSLFILLALVLGTIRLHAQTATPAQPVDPGQARPATPVNGDVVAPPRPAVPSANAAPAAPPAEATVAVIAESSLKAVLSELAQTWADSQPNSPQVPLTLTNSGTILSRVETTPGFDVVISASIDDIKTLTDRTLVFADGQRSLARNSVVIYGRKALLKDDDLEWFDLVGSEWKKVALGKPDLVSSGRVAQRALQKRGLINDDNKDVFTYGMTDSLAVAVVQRDQADAVFAFRTDAAALNLHGFEIFPLDTADAPPVFYTAAVCRLSRNPVQARAFIDYCGSDAAKPIWAKYGFETN